MVTDHCTNNAKKKKKPNPLIVIFSVTIGLLFVTVRHLELDCIEAMAYFKVKDKQNQKLSTEDKSPPLLQNARQSTSS